MLSSAKVQQEAQSSRARERSPRQSSLPVKLPPLYSVNFIVWDTPVSQLQTTVPSHPATHGWSGLLFQQNWDKMQEQIKSQTLPLENRNRIVIPRGIYTSRQQTSQSAAEGCPGNHGKYTFSCKTKVPTGESPTTLHCPGGAESAFQPTPHVKLALAGLNRWTVPLYACAKQIKILD